MLRPLDSGGDRDSERAGGGRERNGEAFRNERRSKGGGGHQQRLNYRERESEPVRWSDDEAPSKR